MTDPFGLCGRSLAGYDVQKFRGSGAFGFVYEAQENASGVPVALKILNPQAAWPQQQEFANEAALLVTLTGASRVVSYLGSERASVTVPGFAVSFPVSFHVFELADAGLDEMLLDLDQLTWLSRLSFFRDAVLGVHQMHLKQIVHRDIKAANCLAFEEGKSVAIKIGDLGRSRDRGLAAMQPAAVYQIMRGDPSFAPPELLWGTGEDQSQVHHCADLYGLGSLLMELSTGQGMTTLAGPTVLPSMVLADPATMRAMFAANVSGIRAGFEAAFGLFEADLPAAIRPHASALVRQLCDPDPLRRLPQVAPGRRAIRGIGLQWLLNRTDIVRLALKNDLEQRARQLQKKGAVV